MSRKSPHSFHDTFWNRVRVDAGMTNQEVADLLHVSDGCISNWFIGVTVPDDATIRKLCELFDIDYNKGHSEFFRARQEYKVIQKRGSKYSYRAGYSTPDTLSTPDTPVDDTSFQTNRDDREVTTVIRPMTRETILPSLYGLLTYQEFAQFTQAMITHDLSVLKSVYGKVTFEDYNLIAEVLKGDGEDEV